MGRYVFNAVVAAAFLVSCSVCLLAADAISAERREGTLGLLFLTRVKALDVLLGKLGSVGILSVGALVAFLPVLMIPVLAGGVTGGEAARKGLALLNTLFFALVAGLCASAASRERFRAVRTAVLIVGLIMVLPFLPYFVGIGRPLHLFTAVSPLVSLIVAGDLHYTSSPAFFWTSVLAVQAMAWTLLVAAGVRLQRSSDDEGIEPVSTPSPSVSRIKPQEREVGLGSWQPVKGESSPIEWLVFRQSGVSAGIWAVALLALAYEGWVPIARQPLAGPGASVSWFFAGAFGVVGALCGGAVVAWVASRFFINVRRTGELELLMTTPLGVETIISEQWNVLKRFFALPVLVMQAPMIPQLLAGAPGFSTISAGSVQSQLMLFKLLVIANTFLGSCALCWLGLWFGLRARTQAGAIVWTVSLAKGLPSLVSLICSVISATFFGSSVLPGVPFYAAVTWMPELMVLLYYVWLIGLARHRLLGELAGVEEPAFELGHSFLWAFSGLRTRQW
jgi:ABC-type transport system involved in multi-copper enzyme maturation permease subunit